jgi:hypothetical protein
VEGVKEIFSSFFSYLTFIHTLARTCGTMGGDIFRSEVILLRTLAKAPYF